MKVYIELVFIENFIINYIILLESLNISKIDKEKNKVIFTSLLGSLYVTIVLILKYSIYINFILNILIFLLMIYLAFEDDNLSNYIKHVINTIYIYSLYAGLNFFVINFFNIQEKGGKKLIVYIITYIILKLCNYTITKSKKINLTKENLIFDIEILVKEKTYKYTAFVDTGNNAKDFKRNMNYIFLEDTNNFKEYLENINCKSYYSNIRTVSGSKKIKIYIVDCIKFKANFNEKIIKNVPICFVERKLNTNNNFNSLIGYDMYLDYLGGMNYE